MKTSSILALSSPILVGILTLIPNITLAQSVGGFGNSGDNRDPFNRASSGDTAGLMQLINQAQLNGHRNNPDSAKEQEEQLNSATQDFRAQQLQVLRQRSQKTAQSVIVEPNK